MVLTLSANVGPQTPARADIDYFANEVQRLSRGGLRVHLTFEPADHEPAPDFEARIVHAVRSGRADLGWVGTSGWDELGISSLQALQTPFLVTDYALLDRLTTSRTAARMLEGLRAAGVVGLALIPGVLAHPVALRRPFVKLADYSGAPVGDVPSRTTDALLRALGAKPVHVTGIQPLIKGIVDAEPADAETEEETGSCPDRCAWVIGSSVTVNVTFFANAETLIANPRVLERLSNDQRAALQTAAARTTALAGRRDPGESALLRTFCRNNGYVTTAGRSDLTALERATAPVAAQLARDPQTAALIAEIRRLKASTPAPASTVPRGCSLAERSAATGSRRSPDTLNGTYRYVTTKSDALAKGDPRDKTSQGLAQYPQVSTQILKDGKWFGGGDCSCELNGTYTITGDRLDFNWTAVGYHIRFTYSRDRDGTLHLTGLPPMENGDRFIFSAEPWRRIGPPVLRPH